MKKALILLTMLMLFGVGCGDRRETHWKTKCVQSPDGKYSAHIGPVTDTPSPDAEYISFWISVESQRSSKIYDSHWEKKLKRSELRSDIYLGDIDLIKPERLAVWNEDSRTVTFYVTPTPIEYSFDTGERFVADWRPPSEKVVKIIGDNHKAAASQLQMIARRFDIPIIQIDTTSPAYLQATLDDGKLLKVKWKDMGKDTILAKESLQRKVLNLGRVLDRMNNPEHQIIDATEPEVMYSYKKSKHPDRAHDSPHRSGHKEYSVRLGDDLRMISMMWGVSVQELRDANDLKQGDVKPGQVITIPITPPDGE